jgi:hypothetical protein
LMIPECSNKVTVTANSADAYGILNLYNSNPNDALSTAVATNTLPAKAGCTINRVTCNLGVTNMTYNWILWRQSAPEIVIM